MINIVVITHGGFADGLMSSLAMVAGDAESVHTFSLHEGDNPDAFKENVKNAIDELNAQPESDGTLVMVDLLGGTPSNCLARILGEESAEKVRCIAGLNFPMLVEAAFNRNSSDLAALEEQCMETAKQGIVSLSQMLSLS